jgi:hypothetical protein
MLNRFGKEKYWLLLFPILAAGGLCLEMRHFQMQSR